MSHPKSVDSGRFQIYDPIGKGGVATVYRAYDRDRNEMCALKILNADSADNEKRRARFLSEAETLQALDHPHIVPVRAVGEADGRLWIAMELMTGGSAARALKVRGPLPALEALDVIHKVLQALELAHERGIIHRDVKPQNILLGEDGAVKLCDFGIARQERPKEDDGDDDAALTQMFDRLGSIIYMAPEQRADPRDVSPATDIYACGATLYALLSGRRPPDLSRAPIRPQMLDPIAPPLRPLILTACAIDRTRRFRSAKAMADEIETVMAHARTNARWYERPDVGRVPKSKDDYAQWPTRPGEAVAPGTPAPGQRAMYRPQTPRGDVDVSRPPIPPGGTPRPPTPGEGIPRPAASGDGAPRGASPRPSPPHSGADRARDRPPLALPKAVWIALAAVAGLLLFAVGLGGGLLAMYLLVR